MIYGHCKDINDDFPSELRELSFDVPAADLRDIAKFLIAAADAMQSGKSKHRACMHWHINEFIKDWNTRFPNNDIVVCDPETHP